LLRVNTFEGIRMEVKKVLLNAKGFPGRLRHIHTAPPAIYYIGVALEQLLQQPCVAIVGSRKVSTYGSAVTTQLAGELARQGVVVISGLALGVDALAHQAALEAGTPTIAVLPCSLERIYPTRHTSLAQQIIRQGGALVSEYATGLSVQRWNFMARNRIVSALSDGVLITEAAEKSGTLHTARFALEQGKEVMAVPGNITSATSVGANNLIKAGATPVTQAADVFHILGLEPPAHTIALQGANEQEQQLLDLIASGTQDGALLLNASQLETSIFNQTLTMLEITGKIRPLGNNQWSVC
jgi:DNA processing protein